jgi:hypothetical protein
MAGVVPRAAGINAPEANVRMQSNRKYALYLHDFISSPPTLRLIAPLSLEKQPFNNPSITSVR